MSVPKDDEKSFSLLKVAEFAEYLNEEKPRTLFAQEMNQKVFNS